MSEAETNRNPKLIEAAQVELLPLIDILRKGKDAGFGCTFEMSARDGVVQGEFVCPCFHQRIGNKPVGAPPLLGRYAFVLSGHKLRVEDAAAPPSRSRWTMDYVTSTGILGRGAKPVAGLFEAVGAVVNKNIGEVEPAATFKI